MIKRKGQEEIVGFVLIVVIVSVLVVIFLAFFIRRDVNPTNDSSEVVDFLQSSVEYTSSCAINFEPDYLKVGELLKECNRGRNCISGESACEVLENTLNELIGASWRFGEDRALKGYRFNSTYYPDSSNLNPKEIIYLSTGECIGPIKGGEDIAPDYPGNIITRMLLCY